MAFEYERTAKAPQRYREKLWAYSHSNPIWLVIFVCETDTIKSLIKRQLDFLGIPSLTSKVGFVDKKDWIAGPSDVVVTLETQRFSIHSLVTPKSYENAREVAPQVAL